MGNTHNIYLQFSGSTDQGTEQISEGAPFKEFMKKIGFLLFGHPPNHPAYTTRSASDTLLQSIDLAVAAEQIESEAVLISGCIISPPS